jgi:hypothetical protein
VFCLLSFTLLLSSSFRFWLAALMFAMGQYLVLANACHRPCLLWRALSVLVLSAMSVVCVF